MSESIYLVVDLFDTYKQRAHLAARISEARNNLRYSVTLFIAVFCLEYSNWCIKPACLSSVLASMMLWSLFFAILKVKIVVVRHESLCLCSDGTKMVFEANGSSGHDNLLFDYPLC